MLHRQESYTFLPVPFFIALCGLLFCGWNLWSAESVPCLTSGCLLFQNFSIGGFPLWWGGVTGFGILTLLALAGRPSLGKLFAGMGLLLDCLLMIILLTAAPCLPCLIAAFLLAACYASFLFACRGRMRSSRRQTFSYLLLIWVFLFLGNIGCLVRDMLAPWPMVTSSVETPISAYVSPSCPACRQLIMELPQEQANKITWYPVAESEQDVRVIATLIQALDQGERLAQALPKALERPLGGQWSLLRPNMFLLQMRLWRNHARVMERGGILPLVEFHGLPTGLLTKRTLGQAPGPAMPGRQHSSSPASSVPARPGTPASPDLPLDLGIGGQCGPMSNTPCEE